MSDRSPQVLEPDGCDVLVTGGAGSLGSLVVDKLLSMDSVRTVRVLDSDEYGLFKLLQHSTKETKHHGKLRLLIGDIRDRERVEMAMRHVDHVVHCAALKNIAMTEEYNAPETVRTNILGTMNLVEVALKPLTVSGKFLFVSSDKAVNSTSIYGRTKAVGEDLVLWADRISQSPRFSCTRFGNIMEARGNVFDLWREQSARGEPITITDPEATRYFWHTEEAADFTISALSRMKGGEIFIPHMGEQQKVKDVAYKVTGLRLNEKMHEELMTKEEEAEAEEGGDCWIIKRGRQGPAREG